MADAKPTINSKVAGRIVLLLAVVAAYLYVPAVHALVYRLLEVVHLVK